jgi:hypothetical protein
MSDGATQRELPTELESLTAEWLTEALSQRTPGTVVEAVEVESVIWGTATKVFLRAHYGSRPDDGPPEALCLKGGFHDELRAIAWLGYCNEARFYRDIQAAFAEAVPFCWYAEENESAQQGLVITDDLRAVGAVFGTPHESQPVDRVAATLELLAGWHGRSWARSGVGGLDWLTVGSNLFRPVVNGFLTPEHWAEYMTRRQTAAFDESLRDRDRVEAAVHRLWEADDADILSISHGDPHVGNTYVIGEGPMRFLDWQTVCLAPWSDDVAYFLVGALDVEQRRAHDRDLLDHYLGALAATGADTPTRDEAWDTYRRHHLHGLMFALCPPEMQPADVCAAMGDRYAAAAIDHETLNAASAW